MNVILCPIYGLYAGHVFLQYAAGL